MKKNILRGLLLALSIMVCTDVAWAALPEDLTVSLRKAVEELSSADVIFDSVSNLYDQETQPKKKRSIEHFVRTLVNPETNPIANIMVYYDNLTYVRTGELAGVNAVEWHNILSTALTQYKASPRANLETYFNIFSQKFLDFVDQGHCKGVSLLKLLLCENRHNTVNYSKYVHAGEVPFEELLKELPHLSSDWFDQTYRGLISGLRPRSTQEKTDRMIFRSLADFFQNHFEGVKEYNFVRRVSSSLCETFNARTTFQLGDSSDGLLEFLHHTLPKSKKILLEGLAFDLSLAQEATEGHSVSMSCEGGSFSLWDSNGYSFESDDLSEFTEKMRRWLHVTFPDMQDYESPMLTLTMTGFSSVTEHADLEIDPSYQAIFQLTADAIFKTSIDRGDLGGVKMTFGSHYFLDQALTGVPKILPSLFADPFLLRVAFYELELEDTGNSRKTQYSTPKKSFLSELSPLKNFITKAKAECALLRAFEVVGTFSEKAYEKSELKAAKIAQRAEEKGLNVEDLLPKTQHQPELWDQVETFYKMIEHNLHSLETLSDVEKQFNFPEAAAIAENFKSANIAGKTALLKDYVNAARKVDEQ